MSPQNVMGKRSAHQCGCGAFRARFDSARRQSVVKPAGTLEADDFTLEKHRRIFKRMSGLQERGSGSTASPSPTAAKFNELEACDGLSYLVSLDDGLPRISNLDSYIRIVKDKAVLRRIIFASQHMMNRCLAGEEEPDNILAGAEETLLKLGDARG